MKNFQNEDVMELTVGPFQCKVRLQNHRQIRFSTRALFNELEKENLSLTNEDLKVLFPQATIGTKYKSYTREELRKKWRREKLLVALVVLALIGLFVWYFFVGFTFTDHNLSNYPAKEEYVAEYASQYMPDIDSLPVSKSIAFEDKTHDWGIFTSHSIQLVVQYDEQTYKDEKARINSEYKFLTQAVKGYYGDYTITAPEFSLNDYHFRVIESPKDAVLGYPHEIGMIAFSDKNNTIAYLFFYDHELDYIDEEKSIDAMAVFVIDNFSPFWE